ncbi:girdin-like [Cucumis melo var. makuwa]|uniref:Girdin-like n=1 Tax=Cucumis melo var. makuwa TaxID=1194695 RepID=A0A5D3DUG2_CUCMM|nr:girdin-like [Cucumis melo var. makuwa]TYK27303.1 girdin-like [Cucumis melo var. makuwa]
MAVWDPTYPRKEAWLSFFAKLIFENVIWKAQWMPLKAVWLKQFIPPTHNLQESDFSYDPEDCQGKKRQVVCTWKSIRKIKDKGHYEGVTSGYEAWQANRMKNIIDISRENELEKTKSFLKNQDKLENDLKTLDKEMRRMNKANRSLKNEKTTLQATVGSQDEYIKDLENGKEYFLELVNDLNTSIVKRETQIMDLEAQNHSLRQTIDNLHLKMAERSEEYEILKNYADSLHFQLTAHQNSSKRITQEYESLNTDYVQMKVDYDLQTRDFQVLVERVDQTIEFLRMVSKRANGFAEWAADLRVNFFSMQPHADDLNRFLQMI